MTAYVDELTAATAQILGEALVGTYPHGSLVLGGWRAETSDVDVLVVVSRPLTASEKTALADALSDGELPCPAVGLELSVVLDSVAADPTPRPAFELHVTTAPEDPKVVDGLGHPGDVDLVLHFAVCNALGYPGFAPVPRAMLIAQLADELLWGARHNPSAYAVLNACRAWLFAAEGRLVSKVDGGLWAAERLTGADLELVRSALALQTGEPSSPMDPAAVRPFALRLRESLRTET